MSGSPDKKKPKTTTELELFDSLFSTLVDDLTKQGLKDEEIEVAMNYFKRVNEYNVPFGKKNRGLTVVHSYRFLKGENADEEEIKIARIVGWCIEWLQAFFLVADDIMDGSHTRRGQPCWYKNEGIGLEAINDSFYLENAIYVLLKKYVRSKSYYLNIIELFHEITMNTIVGQCLDMATAETSGHVDFTNYTIEKHRAIVKWKTAFYSFYLPVAAAMYMAGIDDDASHANAKTILLKMGEYFQIQDDYLDCFGEPEVIGKIGTDIQDNKCSWLVVQALSRATPEQRTILEENYADDVPEKIAKVKDLYKTMGLQEVYTEYEEQSYKDLSQLIEKLSGNLPKEMFTAFAQKIYKRQK